MSSANLSFLDAPLEKEKDYWLQKLAGDPVITSLPLDYPRPARYAAHKESVAFRIDGETELRLRKLCGNSESLLFTAFIMALKICLFKYTGNEDLIIGTTIHERYTQMAAMNKLLALRSRLRGEMTIKQLLLEIKNTLAEAYAHQKYSFERILELLNVEQPVNRTPLFNIIIVLENINNTEHLRQLKNDVTLALHVSDHAITGTLEYNSDLFRRETIEVFSRHFIKILAASVQSPELAISQLELLSESRKAELVVRYNNTERDYPTHKTIVQLFAEQVERTPAHIALEFQNASLTYLELERRANQLAHWLRARGIRPGVPVGIYLEHLPETIVAVLGVLKAGGFYVPFDTGHPRARLDFMLSDASIRLLLTQERLREKASSASEVEMLCLDSEWEALAGESVASPITETTAGDLAYVIYTSGSTGEPKGVKVQHAALVNYICWARDEYVRGESLTFALYSSLAFDLTVTSIYTPLITGNRIVIYRHDGGRATLEEILRADKVGVLKLTPSHLSLIRERDNSQSSVRRLIVGGEAFETELAQAVSRSFGGRVEIINEYGPTEATVGCMIYRFDPAEDVQTFVPIGSPAANVQVYVLDEQFRPVAENVLGEIFIAGAGLAEGYLAQPALTAEKFIENPFQTGQRMYRTGDLARWLPRGVLEYVGRKDEQVKYHGYRIELNEIKSALNRHPHIRDSIVVITKDRTGNDAMIAYYVARQELDSAELHAFLAHSIIQETIPNVFVHLKKLPLTLNGKPNLRVLPTLDEVRQRAQRSFIAPRNRTEETLADIWKQVFRVVRVGIHDNFFELGGHSLIATQVIARVRETFRTELLVRSVFEAPTIAELATAIAQMEELPKSNHTPITRRIDQGRAGHLLEKVEELSDSELDILLAEMLAEEKVSE